MHGLETGRNVTDFAGANRVDGFHARREDADFNGAQIGFGGKHAQHVGGFDSAFHDADVGDDAFVGIIMRVEDHRADGFIVHVFGRRHALDNGLKHLFDVQASLRGDLNHVGRVHAEQRADIFRHFVGTRGGQINFVDDGDDGQVGFERLIEVRERLRFDALGRVHDENRAFAGFERTADFVAEVHVTWSVNEVEFVFLIVFRVVVHAHGGGFDGDAFLAFQVHRVERLLGHIALGDGSRQLQESVRERGFAVVYVGDDAEVSDVGGHR